MSLVSPEDGEIVERRMPVNSEGQATGPTTVIYASGLACAVAYWLSCCECPAREPFFSPSDRDAYAEVHRTDNAHAVELTVEPWDYRTPPFVAADGIPLTPPRSLTT